MNKQIEKEIRDELLERFLRYVQITTMSDPHSDELPSTPGQWDLLRLLERELRELGIEDLELDDNGYLVARVPGSDSGYIGLMAHVDTSSDTSGIDVKPRVHKNYDGNIISLQTETVLDPAEFPELAACLGKTIITSDGTTLLGADDKAGIAEIMTAVSFLLRNKRQPRCGLELIFTPDEETGKGLSAFDPKQLRSSCCYTIDGGERGTIEGECFNAALAVLRFQGKMIHLGSARGGLVNAVSMAGSFINMLPASESPEATDGRYGYFAALEMGGSAELSTVSVYLRDFEKEGMERRKAVLKHLASAVEAAYPGGKVELEIRDQYHNMRDHIASKPEIMDRLEDAIRKSGVEPERRIIRGGTDGSRLSELGIPTPNMFTGGHNYHSRYEWACLETMCEACESIIHLSELWADS